MQKRKIAGKILDAYKTGADYVEFHFKNGSSRGLGNVRGLRRQSLIFEEVIEQDETKVNEVYIMKTTENRGKQRKREPPRCAKVLLERGIISV